MKKLTDKKIKSAASTLGTMTSKKKAISSRENGKLGGYHKWKKNLIGVDNQNAQKS